MKRTKKIAIYLIAATAMVVSFQNCSPDHMLGSDIAATSTSTPGLPPEQFAALQTQAMGILANRCTTCHDGTASSPVPDTSNLAELKGPAKYIVPGQPQNSVAYLTIIDGTMPKGFNMVNNAPNEVETLRYWIQNMR